MFQCRSINCNECTECPAVGVQDTEIGGGLFWGDRDGGSMETLGTVHSVLLGT